MLIMLSLCCLPVLSLPKRKHISGYWKKQWQEKKGMTENEMAGWQHQLNGHGFGWTLGVGDGQGGLACCGSCGRKELDKTERLN